MSNCQRFAVIPYQTPINFIAPAIYTTNFADDDAEKLDNSRRGV